MSGRRRHARYRLSEPIDGRLHVREEVAIESQDGDTIVVLSPAPSRPDEALTLEVTGPAPRRLRVRVTESRPIVAPDGSLQHRVRLTLEPSADQGGR